MKTLLTNNKGITLIELIIGMAIVLIISVPLSTAFISVNNTFALKQKEINAVDLANLALNNIKNEISFATSATVINAPSNYASMYYLYVDNGIPYIRYGNTTPDKPLVPTGMLSDQSFKIILKFSSPGGRKVNVEVTVTDTRKNQVLKKVSSSVYIQNLPIGTIVANGEGAALAYAKPV